MRANGPLARPDSQKQGSRPGPRLVVPSAPPSVPPPPTGLTAVTKAQWASFWTTDMAGLVIESDMPALHRLFELREERVLDRRTIRYFEHGKGLVDRLVRGSTGQAVLNPLYKLAMDRLPRTEKAISDLEDRFGLTPHYRLKMGVAFGDAARSLEDLNRPHADDDAEPDPRTTALQLANPDQRREVAAE